MENDSATAAQIRHILGVATAARMAGYSTRHFRRIIQEDRIRVIQIGRKSFILGSDLSRWITSEKLHRR